MEYKAFVSELLYTIELIGEYEYKREIYLFLYFRYNMILRSRYSMRD